ncbi:KH domain-containing protein, partial [Providencia huashanensis]|uniref:KH domain-containing protein n=1 Tax=Providencia huashanensis TaxID=3037798 RepID=UPI002B00117C
NLSNCIYTRAFLRTDRNNIQKVHFLANHTNGLILVEREGQKKMVIGNKGSKLKTIGTEARIDMERMFDNKVHLELWVKVKSGWADDERALRSLGYVDDLK